MPPSGDAMQKGSEADEPFPAWRKAVEAGKPHTDTAEALDQWWQVALGYGDIKTDAAVPAKRGGDAMRKGSEAGKVLPCPFCDALPNQSGEAGFIRCSNKLCITYSHSFSPSAWANLPRFTQSDLHAARLSGARKCKEAVQKQADENFRNHGIINYGIELDKLDLESIVAEGEK